MRGMKIAGSVEMAPSCLRNFIAVTCLLTASSLGASQPPPHSRPRGIRVAPVPPGEGGGLWIRAPRVLCADAGNEFHLHQRVEPGGTRFVAELQADNPPCEWRFNDLAEGEYEVLIQAVSTGRTVARNVGHVVRGETRMLDLQSLQFRVQGFVTSGGRPRPDLNLRFQADGPVWVPESRVPIGRDGQYEAMLGDESHGDGANRYCAWLSATEAANHIVTCRALSAQWDFDIAPGAIQVIVPPFTTASGTQWAHVTLRGIRTDPPGDSLVQPGGSATFKSKDGFRGVYIGQPYGELVVILSVGDHQSDATTVSSAPVTLTERDPVVEVTFPVR